MKSTNTSRLHGQNNTKPKTAQARNGTGGKAKSLQAEIAARRKAFGKQFHLPKDAKHQSCLIIFDREFQEPVLKIKLTEDEIGKLFDLRITNFVRDKSPERDIVADCLRRFLLNAPHPDKLQDAVYQVKALLNMLCDILAQVGGYGDGMICGIQHLIWNTEDTLENAIEAATGVKLEK